MTGFLKNCSLSMFDIMFLTVQIIMVEEKTYMYAHAGKMKANECDISIVLLPLMTRCVGLDLVSSCCSIVFFSNF